MGNDMNCPVCGSAYVGQHGTKTGFCSHLEYNPSDHYDSLPNENFFGPGLAELAAVDIGGTHNPVSEQVVNIVNVFAPRPQ